ncbi:MAG: hypothetical protein ACRYGR_02295 [Janthinobacterium lividum]
MRVSLKVLWATVGVVMLTIIVILSLWDVPAPQTEIQKNIPIDHLFGKGTLANQSK